VSTRAGLIRLLNASAVEHQLLETPAGGWALLVPALGARVLGAGLGERNAFWVSPALERCLEGKDWNAGGLRTWLAPELGPRGFFGREEGDWAVPPALDPGAYRLVKTRPAAALCRGECRISSADGTLYHLQIDRQVEIGDLPGDAVRLSLRHCLRNLGPAAIGAGAGLWSILQLPCQPEGAMLLPDLPYRPYFSAPPADWVSRQEGKLQLRTAPGRRWKIGQRPGGPEALLVHRRMQADGQVEVAVRWPVFPEALYLDKPLAEPGPGDPLQAFNSPLDGREAFCELECHAPAVGLAPGQEEGQTVEILIRHGP
jgi:hypothetical protein